MDVLGAMGVPSPSSLRGMGLAARERLVRLGSDVEGGADDAAPHRNAAAGTQHSDWESEAAERYAGTIEAWSGRAEGLETLLSEIARELRLAADEVDSAVEGLASWLEGMEQRVVETAGRAAKNAGEVLVHEATQALQREIESVREQSAVWDLPAVLERGDLSMRNPQQRHEDLADWPVFLSAPAGETGAFQNGFGAMGRGSVVVQKSARRQKVDTEVLADMEKTLLGAAAGYLSVQLRLAATTAEIATFWAPMSRHARRAVGMLLGAQCDLADLSLALGECAAKLETARHSYEHAEQVASMLVARSDSLHSAAFRFAFSSAWVGAGLGGVVGALAGLGAGLVPEAGLVLADAKLRGTGAATASSLRGSTVPLENLRRGLVAAKRAERAAGFGLVRLENFHEVRSQTSRLDRDGGIEFLVQRLNDAGDQDDLFDSLQGLPQDQVETAHLDVAVVTRPDGTKTFLVSVPGTDFDNTGALGDPNSLATIFDVASTAPGTPLAESPAMMQAVDRALAEAGADRDSEIVLSGFSQGGIHAMALASNREFTRKHRVLAVVTTGTPTETYTGVDESIRLLHLRDVDDPVPRSTGGGTDPGNDQATVVHSRTGEPGRLLSLTHNGQKYREAARTTDAELGGTAEGREYLELMKSLMPAGPAVVTRTYETGQRIRQFPETRAGGQGSADAGGSVPRPSAAPPPEPGPARPASVGG